MLFDLIPIKESGKKKLLFLANGFPFMSFFEQQEILDGGCDLRINNEENTHVHFKANVN